MHRFRSKAYEKGYVRLKILGVAPPALPQDDWAGIIYPAM